MCGRPFALHYRRLRDPMCSVIDSSMPVHSKAGGNFLLFGDSEGGDKTIGRVTVLNIGHLLASHTRRMSIYLNFGKISVLISRFALPTDQKGAVHVSNCYQLHLMPVKEK